MWLGEFGTDNTSTDIENTAAGSQGQWFESLVSFLQNHPQINWTCWALNGEDSYGLLDSNYDATPVSAMKQSELESIQFPLGGMTHPPGFSLAQSAAAVSETRGSSATDTITVTDTGGFTGAVTLSASGLPSGVTATFGTNPTTGSSVARFAASSSATAGTSVVTIRGVSGTTTASTTITLTVNASTTTGFACHVVYTINSQWPGGFGVGITLENTGTTNWTSWTLTWTFANGQSVTQLWNGAETQSGAKVTVSNLSYNGSIAAGGSYNGMGFNGSWNNSINAIPTAFAGQRESVQVGRSS